MRGRFHPSRENPAMRILFTPCLLLILAGALGMAFVDSLIESDALSI